MNQNTRRIRAEEMVGEVLKHIGARDTIRGALSLDEGNGITRGTLVNIERSINESNAELFGGDE